MAGADLPQRAVERGLKPLVAERLEEIADRLCLERAQRVLVVGGHEDDFRHRHVGESRTSAESTPKPSSSGIWTSRNISCTGAPSPALVRMVSSASAPPAQHPTSSHPVVARQQPAQPLATWLLVIHDQRANGLHRIGRY